MFNDDMTKGQKIFMGVMLGLTFIAIFVSTFVIYQFATMKKPWTLGVTYASQLTYDQEQKYIAEAHIYGNDNNNGQAVFELQFNSYTDTDGTGVEGLGIQAVGEWDVGNIEGQTLWPGYVPDKKTWHTDNIYLYKTTDGQRTYYVLPENQLDDYLLIDINGEFYRLVLQDYSYTVEQQVNFGKYMLNLITFQWNKQNEYIPKTARYTWYEVFDNIMNSAINNSGKEIYTDYSLSSYDLSKFFRVQKKNEKGQYYDLEEASDYKTCLNIPVKYSKDGLINASQSKFGMIANSTNYSYYEGTPVEDYWNATTNVILTEDYLTLNKKDTDTYYLTIDSKLAEYLNNRDNLTISALINIDNINYKVVGIDISNFTFEMDSFEIEGIDSDESFTIYNQFCGNKIPTIRGV